MALAFKYSKSLGILKYMTKTANVISFLSNFYVNEKNYHQINYTSAHALRTASFSIVDADSLYRAHWDFPEFSLPREDTNS